MTAPDFASMLGSFVPAEQFAAPKAKHIKMQQNAEDQKRFDSDALNDFKDHNGHMASGEQGKMLEGMVKEIHKNIPKKIPEATFIPPVPHIVIFDNPEILTKTYGNNPGTANTIAVSTGLLKKLSPDEIEVTLAHEMAGHELMNVNPSLQKNYIPPNLPHVIEDMKSQGIDANPAQDLRREKIYVGNGRG